MASDKSDLRTYQCPRCNGGFPETVDGGCPWCGLEFGEHNPIERLRFPGGRHEVSMVSKKEDEPSKGVVGKVRDLFR